MQEGFINTSGQCKDAVVPKEVSFYNYGAVVFGYIWLSANGLMSPKILNNLRDFEGVLFSNVFVSRLGKKANAIAWKYRHWDSLETFLRIQRRWSMAGKIILTIVLLALSCIVLGFVYLFLRELFPQLNLPQI